MPACCPTPYSGNKEEVDEGAFRTTPCPISRSDDEEEVDEKASKTSCAIPRSEDEEDDDEEEDDEKAFKTSPDEPSLSRGLDDNIPSQEMAPNALESTLTASLGPGPVTYVSEAHAIEFELQDGSLDEELPVKMTITQGLAFVDCRTEGTARWDGRVSKDWLIEPAARCCSCS